MNTDLIYTQTIRAKWLDENEVALDILRLDEMHPVVSGNKWFKLKYYIEEALQQKKDTIATFGGAWSNHIIATAYMCKKSGLKCIGFIRGEEPLSLSATLVQSQLLGMQLLFVNREHYRNKQKIMSDYEKQSWYFIDEGGYGKPGAKGAAEILDHVAVHDYTHLIASVGTGTMLAGLLMAARKEQQVVGINTMKGNNSLEKAITDLLSFEQNNKAPIIFNDYHFGGYAKHPQLLLAFINQAWEQFQLPLDIVYTGKLFFAIMDLITKKYFPPNSNLLMIHSGGLQGNSSLPKHLLSFS